MNKGRMKTGAKLINVVRLEMVREDTVRYGNNCIKHPQDIADIGSRLIGKSDRESLMVICLDVKNIVNAVQVVAIGTLNSCVIHPREVFKTAILSNSLSIALVHNHPSGDSNPSNHDIELTNRLIEAGRIMDIKVLDHVIIAAEGFYSLSENRLCSF